MEVYFQNLEGRMRSWPTPSKSKLESYPKYKEKDSFVLYNGKKTQSFEY
jgi:hypothetical protein